MSGTVIDALKRANAPRPPEDSLALRATVLGAVMTGTGALASVGAVSPVMLTVVLVLLPAGYWVSYVRRRSSSWSIKIGLTVGAILALVRFFEELRAVATLDEARFPLATLFLAVQVLHGFDLPARKDLNFSLGSSLALMAVAGTLSQDMTYGTFLLVYFAFVMGALTLSHRSELRGATAAWMTPGGSPVRGPFPWRDVVRAAVPVALCGALIFMVLPQTVASQYFSLPFSLGGIGAVGSDGVTNPGFGGAPSTRSSGSSYYGFDDTMDLRIRGDLPDDLVMRVRAPAPAMWRGIVFGTYDGVSWEGGEEDAFDFTGLLPPYAYPPALRSLGPRATLTQTYYIEAEQANVIFAAGQPDTIWYEGGISIDELGGVRTPSTLTEGTVYSVVSTRGSASPEQLRSLPKEPAPEAIAGPYLQLPSSLPDRVGDLARRITRHATTDYDRVVAIEDYLRANYEYSLDSPVPPGGRDAVDHFLFDADVGFCEQFASATAVMLRTLGIPARVVAGYAPGSRNSFSGYFDVRASDAHAWVEVWFPNYGWYEFDPTFAIPPANAGITNSVPLLRAIAGVMRALKDAGPAMKTGLGVAASVALAVLLWFITRTFAPRRHRTGRAPLPPGAGPVTVAFRRLEDALAARGAGRAPPETAGEVLARTARFHGAGSRRALGAFERERYGPLPPGDDEVEDAVAELDRLTQAVRDAP